MRIKALLVGLAFISLHGFAAESEEDKGGESISGEEILEHQRKQIENVMVDLNKASKDLYETMTTEPQNVVESGCLGDLRNISLDGLVVDPADLLAGVYASLKDQLYDLACNAASDFANQATEKLNASLELPYGLGKVGVSQGGGIGTDPKNIFKTEVTIDSDEVAVDVTEGVLKDARISPYSVSRNVRELQERVGDKGTASKKRNELEKNLEGMLDINKLFGGDDKKGDGKKDK